MIEDVIIGMHLGVWHRVIASEPAPGARRSPRVPTGPAALPPASPGKP